MCAGGRGLHSTLLGWTGERWCTQSWGDKGMAFSLHHSHMLEHARAESTQTLRAVLFIRVATSLVELFTFKYIELKLKHSSSVAPATFLLFRSHMCLMPTIWDSAETTFPSLQKVPLEFQIPALPLPNCVSLGKLL